MQLIQQFTADPLQKQTLILPDGSTFTMTIYYRPLQIGWFIDTLTYGDFTLKGVRITDSPNMLNQFRNQIPFGIACYTQGNREPTQQEDFSSLNSKLYLLSEAECEEYAEYLRLG